MVQMAKSVLHNCYVRSGPTLQPEVLRFLTCPQTNRFDFQPLPAVTARPNGSIGVRAQSNTKLANKQSSGEAHPFAEAAASIRFRYFDGQRWHERWDSHERQGLPPRD